jgi:hypothetical protein
VVGAMIPNHLKDEGFLPEVGQIPKGYDRSICPRVRARFPDMMPWKGAPLRRS